MEANKRKSFMKDIYPFSVQGYTDEKLNSILNFVDNADTREEELFLSGYVRTLISMAKQEVVMRAELELIDGAISNRRVFDKFTTRSEKILFACDEASKSSARVRELEQLLKVAREEQIVTQMVPSNKKDSLNKKLVDSHKERKHTESEVESMVSAIRKIMSRHGNDGVLVTERMALGLSQALSPFSIDASVEEVRTLQEKETV